MTLKEQIAHHNTTTYRLAKDSGVPYSTINDICTGKSRIENASAGTVYRLSLIHI